jgi:hypothetical protein
LLLLIPYFYIHNNGLRLRAPGATAAAIVGGPALLAFAFVRVITPVTAEVATLNVVHKWIGANLGSMEGLLSVLSSVASHSGLCWILLALYMRITLDCLRKRPELAFMIAANLVLGVAGGSDTDRLMYYAFPAELLLLAHVLHSAGVDATHEWRPVAGLAVLGQVVISQTFAQEIYAANVFPCWNLASWGLWGLVIVVAHRGATRPFFTVGVTSAPAPPTRTGGAGADKAGVLG